MTKENECHEEKPFSGIIKAFLQSKKGTITRPIFQCKHGILDIILLSQPHNDRRVFQPSKRLLLHVVAKSFCLTLSITL